MTNLDQPEGGASQVPHYWGSGPGDSHPTEQLPFSGPAASGQPAGAGGAMPPVGPPNWAEHLTKDRRRAFRWMVGIIVVCLLVGGVVAGLSLTHQASSGSAAANGPSGQAALLSDALNAAGTQGTASAAGPSTAGGNAQAQGACTRAQRTARAAHVHGHPLLAQGARDAALRCRMLRHRILRFFLLRGVEGQFTFQVDGATKTLAYERGTAKSVSSQSITVTSADGTTWTWALVGDTVVRQHGSGPVSRSTLHSGQQVWVGGPVVSGTKDARLIVINPPLPPAAGLAPAPAPTASGG
ncbi:MAG TPA: hypothetical protein VGS19_16430 [Streptosporangiaceae bacterium]|nr:hypothetical protein [Streptosporangiaceae bacterium]